jgi:alpha-N-arabinofuranosidase
MRAGAAVEISLAIEYAVEFRRFTAWVPEFATKPMFIASGPNVADYAWTRSFFTKMVEKDKRALRHVYGCALHYYCGTTGKGESVDFTDEDWYALLTKATHMEELIKNHWQVMGEVDAEHAVKLIVDEWGAWHHTDPTIDPRYLYAYFPTLRDALVSGITLDTFNRHADKVAMANAAQLVNNIHASFLAVGEKFTVTPIYHVFRMYAAHQGGTALRCVFSTGDVNAPGGHNLQALSGSCSVHDKHAVLTAVNPDIRNAQAAQISVRGARIHNVKATVLSSTDIHTRNTFEHPHALEPTEKSATAGDPLVFEFGPASVTRLEFDLS